MMRTNAAMPVLASVLAPALYCAGCSPGLVGTREFTNDSKYLVWQEIHYWLLPPSISYQVSRTSCLTGHTVVLGKGDFLIDADGRHVLLFPDSDNHGEWAVVQIESAKKYSISAVPVDFPPNARPIDFRVETLLPPAVEFTLVNPNERQASVLKYRDGAWQILETAVASDLQLNKAKARASQTVFAGEQVRTGTKKTCSPNSEFMLFEQSKGVSRFAELRRKNEKGIVLLVIQTDHLWDWPRRFGELLVYGGK